MLKPLFSPYRDHVGWISPGRFIFDTEMSYLAFVAGHNAWSGRSGAWLGPIVDAVTILDVDGRPVAWNPDAAPRCIGQPMRPVGAVRAITPPRPVRPVYPRRPLAAPYCAGGWSSHSFVEWLALGDLPPELEAESGPLDAKGAAATASEPEAAGLAATASPGPIETA